jgi:hypothetical protein
MIKGNEKRKKWCLEDIKGIKRVSKKRHIGMPRLLDFSCQVNEFMGVCL